MIKILLKLIIDNRKTSNLEIERNDESKTKPNDFNIRNEAAEEVAMINDDDSHVDINEPVAGRDEANEDPVGSESNN